MTDNATRGLTPSSGVPSDTAVGDDDRLTWGKTSWGVWPGAALLNSDGSNTSTPARRIGIRRSGPSLAPVARFSGPYATPPTNAYETNFVIKDRLFFSSALPPLVDYNAPIPHTDDEIWNFVCQRTILVSHLSPVIVNSDVWDALISFGTPRAVRILSDFWTGISACIAVAEFTSAEAVTAAVAAKEKQWKQSPSFTAVFHALPPSLCRELFSPSVNPKTLHPHWAHGTFIPADVVNVFLCPQEKLLRSITPAVKTSVQEHGTHLLTQQQSMKGASKIDASTQVTAAIVEPKFPPRFPFMAAAVAATIILERLNRKRRKLIDPNTVGASLKVEPRIVSDENSSRTGALDVAGDCAIGGDLSETWPTSLKEKPVVTEGTASVVQRLEMGENSRSGIKRLQEHLGRWHRRLTLPQPTSTSSTAENSNLPVG